MVNIIVDTTKFSGEDSGNTTYFYGEVVVHNNASQKTEIIDVDGLNDRNTDVNGKIWNIIATWLGFNEFQAGCYDGYFTFDIPGKVWSLTGPDIDFDRLEETLNKLKEVEFEVVGL